MNTLIDTYKNIDLYGSDVFLAQLKAKYNRVSYTSKSIPSAGSPCKPSTLIRADLQVQRAVFHNNDEVTVFTQYGNLRFWQL